MSYYKPTILVVDDELSVGKSLSILLKRLGNIDTASSGEEALEKLEKSEFDLVLLDIRLPKMSGIEVLRKIKNSDENTIVIMITAVQDSKTAVEAMKIGAYDYIVKPFNIPELRMLVSKALEKRTLIKENLFLHSEISRLSAYDELIGESPEMKQVFKLIDKAAASSSAVIIQGESGTGKELIARAIHSRSSRCDGPLVVINCAGIPDNLLESELFGHEAGAFTGAVEKKEGKFETADGGTIFLDEIGSMSLNLQAKILRVLQEKKDGTKEVERIGSPKAISVDVRVVSATNKDLKKAMEEGKFREDLYYRLNVFPIGAPPLRERKEDVPLLVDYFIERYNNKLDKQITGTDKKALNALMRYSWPGNVRELKNIIERVVALKREGVISVEDLPVEILMDQAHLTSARDVAGLSISSARGKLEKQLIKKALDKTKGNQVKASKILGIHRNTLMAKIDQLGIRKEQYDRPDGSHLH